MFYEKNAELILLNKDKMGKVFCDGHDVSPSPKFSIVININRCSDFDIVVEPLDKVPIYVSKSKVKTINFDGCTIYSIENLQFQYTKGSKPKWYDFKLLFKLVDTSNGEVVDTVESDMLHIMPEDDYDPIFVNYFVGPTIEQPFNLYFKDRIKCIHFHNNEEDEFYQYYSKNIF